MIKIQNRICYNVAMIKAYNCTALSVAMEKLTKIVADNEKRGVKTIVFSEDRLTLAAERAICTAVGGTFFSSVYTFSRFMTSERGKNKDLLSSEGSAMVIRKLITENKQRLRLFKKLSAASAAQSLYGTIALFYAAGISADDISEKNATGLLGDKLHDISLIYGEYEKYLSESGKEDRNGYLRKLSPIISNSQKIVGNAVIFLGFQAFTGSTAECVKAAFASAKEVTGLFIGGEEELYVNEALPLFVALSKPFGGAVTENLSGSFKAEAEHIRANIFDADAFYRGKLKTSDVYIFEGGDMSEEFEFIASNIKKYVLEGKRYSKISVMLPDIKNAERSLNRVFTQYRIPYYSDRRFSLLEHPVSEFVLGYLNCLNFGCRPEDVDAVISSDMFGIESGKRDIFRNYSLRFANYRSGVMREPKAELLRETGYDEESVYAVRTRFLDGLSILKKSVKSGICGGIRSLLEHFNLKERLNELASEYADSYPMEAEFCSRVYEGLEGVLNEAEFLEAGLSCAEFVKVIKSGLQAAEISLIPPKSDAVFVGDLTTTANTGSDVVFAANLTGDVPISKSDTSLLSDREIDILEEAQLNISPKIRQVNLRLTETAALNLCAFRERLFLTYPLKVGGDEQSKSEIINYVSAIFSTTSGGDLKPINMAMLEKSGRAEPYFCSELLPALKRINRKGVREDVALANFKVLSEHGFEEEAKKVIVGRKDPAISCGERLFAPTNSISPTTIETYFSCPYKNFIKQGLNLKKREEGAFKETDTGNFIHSVLQNMKEIFSTATSEEEVRDYALNLAQEKLSKPPFSSLNELKSGEYTENLLKAETVQIAVGVYRQLSSSKFALTETEKRCSMPLYAGMSLKGQIDRIDSSESMVRVIDYKTGSVYADAKYYYMGTKLQLPLYLLAASKDKRAVGAYYFPASVNYEDKADDGIFRLAGFMDGSDEVVFASDTSCEKGKKSKFINAYYGGKRLEGTLSSQDFPEFLNYSKLVAAGGVREMLSGNIAPSPNENACEYCDAKSVCGFKEGVDGATRSEKKVNCEKIAEISKRSQS